MDVPTYDELAPDKIIEELNLRKNETLWQKLLNFCPELEFKKNPKNRDFFFNILNFIQPNIVDKMLHNAIKKMIA